MFEYLAVTYKDFTIMIVSCTEFLVLKLTLVLKLGVLLSSHRPPLLERTL